MAKSTQTNQPQGAVAGASVEAKAPKVPTEVEVTSANTFAEVLDYDQKGARIMFACEKGQFLSLADDEVAQLSKFTRSVYQAMKAQNALIEAEDPSWEGIKRDLKIGDTRGSAAARMAVKGGSAGMETRYFRPDNLGTAEAKGWVPVKVGEYKVAGSHEGHVSIKAHGEDELILFKRPKDIRVANDKARREKKAAQSKAEKEQFKEVVDRAGYRALQDGEVANGRYKDIE
jgi:hypothetical protein